MSHAEAILEAVLAEPEEVTHRLVYADWLDEHGDETARQRAEFIRVQVERDRLPPFSVAARRLRRREEELLARYGRAWAGALTSFCLRWAFRRGFVEAVTLTAEPFLEHGTTLFRLAPICRLNLRGTGRLVEMLAGRRQRKAFSDLLGHIRFLDLNREYISEATARTLLDLPRLPRLEGLYLGHNTLNDAGARLLAGSSLLSGLRILEFTPSTSTPEGVEPLLHAPGLDALEELILSGSRAGNRLAAVVASSPVLGQLRTLALGHSNLDAASLEMLLEPGQALEQLDLSFNPLGMQGVRLLDASLPRLTVLNLSRTGLGDDGASSVGASSLPRRLFGLDLSLNGIGPEGGLALARFASVSRLETLDLIYNSLGAGAMRALRERFGEDVCLFRR